MNGHKYEHRCAQMLRRKGFHHVEVTKKSGDQGVDIIAYKHFSKYAIQTRLLPIRLETRQFRRYTPVANITTVTAALL